MFWISAKIASARTPFGRRTRFLRRMEATMKSFVNAGLTTFGCSLLLLSEIAYSDAHHFSSTLRSLLQALTATTLSILFVRFLLIGYAKFIAPTSVSTKESVSKPLTTYTRVSESSWAIHVSPALQTTGVIAFLKRLVVAAFLSIPVLLGWIS